MRLKVIIRFFILFMPAVLLLGGAFAGIGLAEAQESPTLDSTYEGQNPPEAQSTTEQKDPELQKIDHMVIDPGENLSGIKRSSSQPASNPVE